MSLNDSYTREALKVLAENLGVDLERVVLGFDAYLRELTNDRLNVVELNQPYQVTTKSPGGKYSKKALIGEEKFILHRAYLGKRNGVIVCGTRDARMLTGTFEFPASDAEKYLDGYNELVDNFVQTYGLESDDIDMGKAALEADRMEKEAYEKSIVETRMEDPRFGSW